MKNWKTTLGGVLASAGASLQLSNDENIRTAGIIIGGLGVLIIGIFGKDSNVTGAGTSAKSL